MNGIKVLVRRFGVLPFSQGITLLLSTATFAWLARELGPEQYARFAVILLFFSTISLVTDLSPQSFILVHGLSGETVKTASQVSIISAIIGSMALMIALLVGGSSVPFGPPSLIDETMLCLTLAIQAITQVPRAEMVVSARYRAMGITDILGTLVGCGAALFLAYSDMREYSLVAQMAVTVFSKYILTILTSQKDFSATNQCSADQGLLAALKYGVRVIPLNLASYLSRALDSGLLPSLVSATAAAGYARSYQIVVVPISQLQLSLGSVVVEKFSAAKRRGIGHSGTKSLKLWIWLQRIAISCGVLIIVSSSLIQLVLFGPRWPLVNVTLSAMATCLPGVAAAAFGAWSTQVDGGRVRTMLHFVSVLITPIAVVVAASAFNFRVALAFLVIVGGLVQPLALAAVHRRSITEPLRRSLLRISAQWLLVAALFGYVAMVSDFWITPL